MYYFNDTVFLAVRIEYLTAKLTLYKKLISYCLFRFESYPAVTAKNFTDVLLILIQGDGLT